MNLALALDFIDSDDYTDWLDIPTTPNAGILDDLVIYDFTDDFGDDVNIWCEFEDIHGKQGRGEILSWHSYPYYDPTIDMADENYAYIRIDGDNGTTYAHITALNPLAKVTDYESTQSALSEVPHTPSFEGSDDWQHGYQGLFQSAMPHLVASLPAIGA